MQTPTVQDFLVNSSKARTQKHIAQIEADVDVEEAKARAQVDFNFYAGLVAPTTMRQLYSPFYIDLHSMLTTLEDDPYAIMRFALGLPRGFVKTTFLKILTCYLIHYGYNYFVLVVCASEPKAIAFLEDVDAMLGDPQVEEIYGRWNASKIVDNTKKRRGVLNGKQITLLPAGSGSAIRGTNIAHERPDLIICDDIQTREGALSEAQNATLIEWFTATLVKSIANYGSNRKIIYLGNMYPGDCLLSKLRANSEWRSLITGAILEDGQSLWPELKPVHVLLDEYTHDEQMGLGHIWFAEVQNDPLDSRYRLLAGPLSSDFDHLTKLEADCAFLTIDPAGFRKKSDDNVIALHKLYDGFPVCTELHGGVWDPKKTIVEALIMAMNNNVCLIAIESVGYQQSLCYWMEYFIKKLGLTHIKVVELATKNATKLSRINDYIKEMQSGESAMHSQARTLFTYFASQYKIGKTDNRDDYLDAPAYQKQVLTLHSHLLTTVAAIDSALAGLPAVVDVDIGIGV